MKNLKDESLSIEIDDSDKITMSWLGRSENREPASFLNPYIAEIIDAISGKELIVDFSKLEYMNSSTVPPIIHMIKNLNTKGIATKIFYDKDSKWQAASFKALETISKAMNCIEVAGK
jgi:anti-anti-sigma regulatory factor